MVSNETRVRCLNRLLANFPEPDANVAYSEDFKAINRLIQSSLIHVVKYYLIVKSLLKSSNAEVVRAFFAIASPIDEAESLYYEYQKYKNPFVYNQISIITKPYVDVMKALVMKHKTFFAEEEVSLAKIFGEEK